MASRWAFEAMATHQYKNNDYEYFLYDFEMLESKANYIKAYLIPELQNRIEKARSAEMKGEEMRTEYVRQMNIIKEEIDKLSSEKLISPIPSAYDFSAQNNDKLYPQLYGFLDQTDEYYTGILGMAEDKKEQVFAFMDNMSTDVSLTDIKNRYHNESLAEMVKNLKSKSRIEEYQGQLLQQIDPIYKLPENIRNIFDYSTHFLSPEKHFLGGYFDTFWFNLTVIWFMTILLYLALYYELLKRLIDFMGSWSEKSKFQKR